MDYCDGGDLYSKINAQRGILFPEEQVKSIIIKIFDIFNKYSHNRSLIGLFKYVYL